MKKIILLLFISISSIYSQDFITKPVFDSLLVTFVDSSKHLYNLSNASKDIKKGPYESTEEYEKRIKQFEEKLKKRFYAIKLKKLEDFFERNSKLYKVMINIDSLTYDPDTEKAHICFDKILIPHNMGVPEITVYSSPIFRLLDNWKAKEGYGLEMIDLPIKRALAKENDIIKTKGRLELDFLFGQEDMIPTMTLKQIKWRNEDKFLWTWKGKARVPVSSLRGEIRGRF